MTPAARSALIGRAAGSLDVVERIVARSVAYRAALRSRSADAVCAWSLIASHAGPDSRPALTRVRFENLIADSEETAR